VTCSSLFQKPYVAQSVRQLLECFKNGAQENEIFIQKVLCDLIILVR
jgi:hypothetical protein